MSSKKIRILSFLPILAFLLGFFYYPLFVFFTKAPRLEFIIGYLTSNSLVSRFLFFTIVQAMLTTCISMILGVPAGYLLARSNAYKLSWFRTLFTVPFIFPPLAVLMGFVITFDNNGIVNSLFNGKISFNPFSFAGIVFAHIIFNISVFARITESSLYSEPKEFHDLALVMGSNKIDIALNITLPHLKPALQSASLLVFLYAFNSFAIVLVLGEVRYQTLEVMIFNQSRNRLRYDRATAIATLQLLVDVTLIVLYLTRSNYQTKILEGETLPRSTESSKSTIILFTLTIIMWFPVIALLYRTTIGIMHSPNDLELLFSPQFNRFLGTSSVRVIFNTIFFGILTALISMIFAILLSLNPVGSNEKLLSLEKLFSLIILIPMTISSITLSFAIILTYGTDASFNDRVWFFILGLHLLSTLPFSSRLVVSARSRIPEDLLLVADSFGSNLLTQFREIIWPYMKNAIFVAMLFAFAMSVGEFAATLYLARGEWVTMSLAIDRLFSSRNALLPNLYAIVLIGFVSILLFAIEKLGSLELRI